MRYQYQGEIIGEASRVRIDSRDSWTWNGRHAPRVRVGVPLIRRTRRERRAPLARPIINRNYYYPRSPPAIRYPAAAAAFCSLSLSLSLSRARARALCFTKLLQPVLAIFYSRKKRWTSSTLGRLRFMMQLDFAEDFRSREVKSMAKWVCHPFRDERRVIVMD
jgi:hypothetical protein